MTESFLDSMASQAKAMFGERNARAEQAEAEALRTFEDAQVYLEQLLDKSARYHFSER